MLKRVGKMWPYGGHYHSFVTYSNAIFRIYEWHLNSQPTFSFFSTISCAFWGYFSPRSNRWEERQWTVWSVLEFSKFVLASLKSSGAPIRPPYARSSGGGRVEEHRSKSCLPRYSTLISATFLLKRYQTEHNFEMPLIKWKGLHTPGGLV